MWFLVVYIVSQRLKEKWQFSQRPGWKARIVSASMEWERHGESFAKYSSEINYKKKGKSQVQGLLGSGFFTLWSSPSMMGLLEWQLQKASREVTSFPRHQNNRRITWILERAVSAAKLVISQDMRCESPSQVVFFGKKNAPNSITVTGRCIIY